MLLKIGQFATLSGVTVETLRHWDAVGLLQPGVRDEESGYRLYDTAQLAVVYRILALKDVGFSLKEMAAILEKHTGTPTLLALLEEKAVSLQKTLALEQVRLERLLNNIFLVKNGGIPIMNETTIKQVSPILVCAQRRTIAKVDFDAELEMM